FGFPCDGWIRGRVNRAAWNRARDVASAALSGEVYGRVGAATHFHTTRVAPKWRHTLVHVGQVGDHLFYRFGGRAGSSNAFSYAARPSKEADVPHLMQASMESGSAEAGPLPYPHLLAQEGQAPAGPRARTHSAAPAPAA